MAFTPDTPISWLVNSLDFELNSIVSGGSAAVWSFISPLVQAGFGIYVLLVAWGYLRGTEQAPVSDALHKTIGFFFVMLFLLNHDTYTSQIVPSVKEIGDGLMRAVTHSANNASPIDAVFMNIFRFIDKLFTLPEDIGILDIGTDLIVLLILSTIEAVILLIGVLPFVVAAVSFLILAKIGIAIVLTVAPIFIAFFIFPATRQYFSSWTNTLLSYTLLMLFVGVVIRITTTVTASFLTSFDLKLNATGVDSLFQLAGICVVAILNLASVFLLKQTPSLASSLSAGGINAGMASAGSALNHAAKKGADEIKGVGDRKESKEARTEAQISRAEKQNERSNKNNSRRIQG
jgi:type IV secretion system protein VirB6